MPDEAWKSEYQETPVSLEGRAEIMRRMDQLMGELKYLAQHVEVIPIEEGVSNRSQKKQKRKKK